MKIKSLLLLVVTLLPLTTGQAAETKKLLNVSYDVTREFYKEYNTAFAAYWKQKKGVDVTVDQSHGGSSKQARSILDGLPADVATMNQETDIEILAKGGLVAADWKKKFPNGSSPYTSTIVFLVRKGNPKGIKDWDDLVKPGIGVIVPNPKTSGNGRYSYLAAWAFASDKFGGDVTKIKTFVGALFHNVPVLDTGGRGATTSFVQNGLGDVLLTFENEVQQISKVFKPDQFDVVIPSSSILAEAPVAVIDKNVDRAGTRELATAYLQYLWSEEGQKLIAKQYYRPRSEAVLKANAALFPAIKLVSVDSLGGWEKLQKEHFNDGGLFDQIYVPQKP
ncbi:MAG: thiosulfate transporter subunit [Verrucomicrobia bacterium Tous-C9LFEB]|nr:MAG: thiosulfate transporter subunit [Verrucomicrobia bacterium Tous-C9LFEB]